MKKEMSFSFAMFAALVASILFGNIGVIEGIIEPWADDGTYSHGYLILAISGYLFWKNRDAFSYPAQSINIIPISAFLLLTGVFSAGLITGIEVVYRSVFPFILASAFYIALTKKAANRLLFPTLFMIFSIPFWGMLNQPLQEISAVVVTMMVEAWGVSAYLDGVYISIGAGKFVVAGGCSGLRYLLVIMTLCSLFSNLYLTDKKSIAKLFLIGLVLSFVTNWVRIFILILLGHYTDMQHEMIEDHNNLGWVLFVIFLYPMYVYANKIADKDQEEKERREKEEVDYSEKGSTLKGMTSVIFVSVITFAAMNIVVKKDLESSALDFEQVVSNIDKKWEKIDAKATLLKPDFIDAEGDTILLKNNSDTVIQLSLYRYLNDIGLTDLTDYRNKAIPDGWSVEDSDSTSIKYQHGDIDFSIKEIERGRNNATIFKVNKVGSKFTNSGLKTKLFKLLSWKNSEQYSGTIIVTMKCERSCRNQNKEIKLFLNDNIDQLERFID